MSPEQTDLTQKLINNDDLFIENIYRFAKIFASFYQTETIEELITSYDPQEAKIVSDNIETLSADGAYILGELGYVFQDPQERTATYQLHIENLRKANDNENADKIASNLPVFECFQKHSHLICSADMGEKEELVAQAFGELQATLQDYAARRNIDFTL